MESTVAPVMTLLFTISAISALRGIFFKKLRASFLCGSLSVALLGSAVVLATEPAGIPFLVRFLLAGAGNIGVLVALALIPRQMPTASCG